MRQPLLGSLSIILCCVFGKGVHAAEPEILKLWTGELPGPAPVIEEGQSEQADDSGNNVGGRSVTRVRNVATPELHVYHADGASADKPAPAVVVCPGGGFNILAWDLEGTEVAAWLNGQGFTAAVCKYRVPTSGHGEDQRFVGPVYDAKRAVRTLRSHASDWHIDGDKIGVLGFSAGGLTAAVAAGSSDELTYPPQDKIDQQSAQANFCVLIYPAWMADEQGDLQPRFQSLNAMPPTFLVHAWDDRVTPLTSTALFTSLKIQDVPAELHVFPDGGHGYGLRDTGTSVNVWPRLAARWLADQVERKAD